MSVTGIASRKNLVVLGLNSGTSADGLDMAAVQLQAVKGGPKIRFLAGRGKPYSRPLREQVLHMANSEKTELDGLIYLDNLLGRFYGRAAAAFIRELAQDSIKVDLIASHGQTVRHLPTKVKRVGVSVSGTMQLGSADFISAETGKAVVSDFRQADVALGNEGAPITVAAMYRLFSLPSRPRLIVNIGGISNYFYFPSKRSKLPIRGEDCGPGNSLCDILSVMLFNKRFDKNGACAARGNISRRLLSLLLANKFFSGRTVSTGRESFGCAQAGMIVDFGRRFGLCDDDLMATAAELTAKAIAMRVQPIAREDENLSKLYLTGGGRRNIFFVRRLQHHLPHLGIRMIDELGISGDYVEAACYAILGEACVRSKASGTISRRKGKRRMMPILGKISQPPKCCQEQARRGKS